MPITEPTQIRRNEVQTVNTSTLLLSHIELKGRKINSCGNAVYWVETPIAVIKYLIITFRILFRSSLCHSQGFALRGMDVSRYCRVL